MCTMCSDQVQLSTLLSSSPPRSPDISIPASKILNSIQRSLSNSGQCERDSHWDYFIIGVLFVCGLFLSSCGAPQLRSLWKTVNQGLLQQASAAPRVRGRNGTQCAPTTLRAQSLWLLLGSLTQQPESHLGHNGHF